MYLVNFFGENCNEVTARTTAEIIISLFHSRVSIVLFPHRVLNSYLPTPKGLLGQQLISYQGRLFCGRHRRIVEPYANCEVLVFWPCYSNSVPGNAKEYYKAPKVSSSSFAGSKASPPPLGRRTLNSDSQERRSNCAHTD